MTKNDEKKKISTKGIASRFVLVAGQIIDSGRVENKTEFCKSVNLQVSNYNKIVAGDRIVCLSRIVDLVNVYGVSVNWLMTGRGSVWPK